MAKIKNIYAYSLTSLMVLATGAASAEQMVTAPTLDGGPTASIGTFYVTPSSDNQAYGLHRDPDGIHSNVLNVTPDYDFGIEASLGYIFEDTANGIELTYRNINTSDSSSGEGVGEINEQDELGSLNSNLGYELNTFDLMISQFMDIGDSMQMRFVGGLAYVELEQNQKTSFAEFEEDVVDNLEDKSEFTGWGPRVGIDARYDFGQGFGIVGGGSVAYYLGDLDITASNFGGDESISTSNDLDSHAVTNLRGNLGIDYVYFFDNEDLSTIGLELGYQVDYYNDVIGALNTPTDTFAATFSGPYLNLKGAF